MDYCPLKLYRRGHLRSLKMVLLESFGYGFLFASRSNCGRIFSHSDIIQECDRCPARHRMRFMQQKPTQMDVALSNKM